MERARANQKSFKQVSSRRRKLLVTIGAVASEFKQALSRQQVDTASVDIALELHQCSFKLTSSQFRVDAASVDCVFLEVSSRYE